MDFQIVRREQRSKGLTIREDFKFENLLHEEVNRKNRPSMFLNMVQDSIDKQKIEKASSRNNKTVKGKQTQSLSQMDLAHGQPLTEGQPGNRPSNNSRFSFEWGTVKKSDNTVYISEGAASSNLVLANHHPRLIQSIESVN
jgi:hypothetical protein